MTAKRILLAQAALLGVVLVAMLVRELPGLVREIRMWRMARLHR
ncbi:hypothetical protein GCM10025787_17700 [Saccharopolyspora rosea]|uniref:Uncharacterized protein n=1 Tax=Saccharopolyspora rosea TaxID=524884 RepID=A0ABW3G028_9PSEU